MRIKKKDLFEIIDSNGDLIGWNDIPQGGADKETQASNTTDYNLKIGTQPFRYDMLGRFGITLMPFFEGKNADDIDPKDIPILKDLAKLMYDKYMEMLEYYYRNPNKLKSDFRMHSEHDFETQPEDEKKIDFDWAKKVISVIYPYLEDNDEKKSVDEGKVIEDKVVDKKSEDEISKKGEDKSVREKQVEKIAGLINKKLEKKDIDKLINLLESAKEETEFSPEDKQKIKDFVLNYKGAFKDEDIHAFADKIGLDKHEVEEFIYGIARQELKK